MIRWFHNSPGPDNDAIASLRDFALQHLGNERYYAFSNPIEVYFHGNNEYFRNKAIANRFLFIEGFYHHNQFCSFYKLLKELLQYDEENEIVIAIASDEAPPVFIKDYCIVNPKFQTT